MYCLQILKHDDKIHLQNEWIYKRKALCKFNYLLITISEVGSSRLRAITQAQQSKTYVNSGS